MRLDVGADRTVRHGASDAHLADLAASESTWLDWFARCPRVRPDLQSMTAFCWWVLGANIVELPALGRARAVVPSKIGYVGLWQWDAYFIAVGLRHGDPELAREQLELAFRFPSADGQLPDVVHEHGVLATSDDLPPGDRENLRRAGSTIADPSVPVPLTKPPLAAWALAKVLEVEPADDWAREQLATIRRSQDWWFAASDLDGDGMPEYGHPYSSGLDDSPIFDGPLPTTAPDLGAYLVLQDLELARFAERFGDADAAAHRSRAERTLELLLDLWDDERGLFRARAAGAEVASDTVVGLMPLLTGRPAASGSSTGSWPRSTDPRRFGAAWSVPTVARRRPRLLARAHVARAGVGEHERARRRGTARVRASGARPRPRRAHRGARHARRRAARVLQPDHGGEGRDRDDRVRLVGGAVHRPRRGLSSRRSSRAHVVGRVGAQRRIETRPCRVGRVGAQRRIETRPRLSVE